MKYSLIIGIICILIAVGAFYFRPPQLTQELFLGTVGGLGIGFLLGGILGYTTKKTKKVIEEKVVEVVVEKEAETSPTSTDSNNDIA